jgi:phenylalanine ammonia-lyase
MICDTLPGTATGTAAPIVVGGTGRLSLEELMAVARDYAEVGLSEAARERMRRSRALLLDKLAQGEAIYGVTTGFGGNAHYQIPPSKLGDLQTNLLRMLKAGVGRYLPPEVVRASMLLRVNALAFGWSSARVGAALHLVEFLNRRVTPLVPEYGSVGASGDLIPTCYIASCLCGEGTVLVDGAAIPAAEALRRMGLAPLTLEAKEGLALLNGTTMMTALAAMALAQVESAFAVALGAIAMAAEALGSSADYYDPRIQSVKGHPGQIAVAAFMRKLLEGSALSPALEEIRARVARTGALARQQDSVEAAPESLQAPYSLRCVPQGLGPMWDSLGAAREVVEREVNSVNDNPLVDPETGDVLHTGNFYGGHIARFLDGMKIDIATLANWLHSIVALLMDSRFSRGLPNSLSPNPGLHQGFKGLQLCHSSLVTSLRQQSAPSSIHTLPTEQYNQDVVSLGTHAALTAFEMSAKLRDVVAMTLLASAQAAELRGGAARLAPATRAMHAAVRAVSPLVTVDRPLDEEIASVAALIDRGMIPVPKGLFPLADPSAKRE